MNIDELLDKYFEGETSAAEEAHLRTFFASEDVPERLATYRPLFAYFSGEIAHSSEQITNLPPKIAKQTSGRSVLLYIASGIAASVLLLLGIGRLLNPLDPCFCSDNYVVINGRCYTDIHKVRSLAIEALQEVATPASEYFVEDDDNILTREILNNQLQELGTLFSDDE